MPNSAWNAEVPQEVSTNATEKLPILNISSSICIPNEKECYTFESVKHFVLVNSTFDDGTSDCTLFAPEDNIDEEVTDFVKNVISQGIQDVEVLEITDVVTKGERLPKEFADSKLDLKGKWELKKQIIKYGADMLAIICGAGNIERPKPLCNWRVKLNIEFNGDKVSKTWDVVNGNILAESESRFGSQREDIVKEYSLSCKQVAEMLEVSESTVYRLVKQGKLTPVNIGNSVCYSQNEVTNLYSNRNAKKLVEDAFNGEFSWPLNEDKLIEEQVDLDEDDDEVTTLLNELTSILDSGSKDTASATFSKKLTDDDDEVVDDGEEDEEADEFSENFTCVLDNDKDKWGYIKSDGSYLIKPCFDYAFNFSKGFARVKQNGKWGYIKTDGSYLIEPRFDKPADFSEGFACVKQNGKWGYIKTDGSYLIKPRFDDACDFSEGFACVKEEGKWGYIKKDGSYLIEPRFDEASYLSEGFACVKQNGKWGYIKSDGSYIIKPCFDYAYNFSKGFALVEENGKWGYIKKDGSYFVKPVFDDAEFIVTDGAEIEIDGKKGKLFPNGKLILDGEEIDIEKLYEALEADESRKDYEVGKDEDDDWDDEFYDDDDWDDDDNDDEDDDDNDDEDDDEDDEEDDEEDEDWDEEDEDWDDDDEDWDDEDDEDEDEDDL